MPTLPFRSPWLFYSVAVWSIHNILEIFDYQFDLIGGCMKHLLREFFLTEKGRILQCTFCTSGGIVIKLQNGWLIFLNYFLIIYSPAPLIFQNV